MADGWEYLNQNAWFASALLLVALSAAALTLLQYTIESGGGWYTYIGVVGLVVLACSFVLVGVSVGERPIVPGRQLLPIIRLLWFAAAVLLNIALTIYWIKRVHWRRE